MEVLASTCSAALNGSSAEIFLTMINALMIAQCALKPPLMEDYAAKLNEGDDFDFIVIGAGSAGSVVANRLTEEGNWRVLVLEAGGDPSTTTQIPALLFSVQGTPEDWQQKTEPQNDSCLGFKEQSCRWPSGRVLGGSSAINGMLYVRGNKRDYDTWEQQGNIGWNYEDALRYYKKSENNIDFGNNADYHGTRGYLTVQDYSADIPVKKAIIEAAAELGVPHLTDVNNGSSILGYGDAQGTVEDSTRLSAYEAFLYSIKDRSNLYVAKNSHVTKIIINPTSKQVTGVEVKVNGRILKIKASKEVILSAGALKTPQILMLSGVGPREHLQEMNIPVIKSLRVGENLQDHISFLGLVLKIDEPQKLETRNLLDNLYNYYIHKRGIFSTVGITNFVGFINTANDSEYPDIQFHHVYYSVNNSFALPVVLRDIGLVDEIQQVLLEENKHSTLLHMWPTLLNQKSRGHIKLNSLNPLENPLIYSNYLKEDSDVETLLRGIKFVQKLMKTKSFSQHNIELLKLPIPNCAQFEFGTDDYFRCALRNLATTTYHYSGTAKMGPSTDPAAVVDPQLKVHGIKGLRVADASIMPNIVSANTNAPAIMIGEKASDLIKQDYHVQ